MEVNKTIALHNNLCSLIGQRRLKEGLDILSQLVDTSTSGEYSNEFSDIVEAYKNMLSYTIDGINDPERDKIYKKLVQSTLKLADKLRENLLLRYSGWNTYWIKQQSEKEQRFSQKSIIESVDDLIFKSELDKLLYPELESESDPNSERSLRHKKLIKNIFNHLWITDYYGEAEESLVSISIESGKFKWHELSVFTSAITLSLFRVWQPEKIKNLFSLYNTGIDQVVERALTGIITALHLYNNRLQFYPEIEVFLEQTCTDDKFKNRVKTIVLQIIRSRETETLSKKLRDEIIPKMAKYSPQIEEKLDLENILPSESSEGRNPDWSAMFADSEEIFRTMEELSKLQMEGADIYMSTFSNLKNFDFFNEFHNWFLPFYPEHELLNVVFNDDVLSSGTDDLAEALYKTPYICNSDKYSMVYNLKFLPASQKKLMLKILRMELDGIREMNEGELKLSDPDNVFKTYSTQYIQDLYRFFKLSPYKKEFGDFFSGKLDIYNSFFFKSIFNYNDDLLFADYFFNKNFFDDALSIFLEYVKDDPSNVQLYEKIGYCFQELFDYENALKYFQRAELIDRKAWTCKKIGYCMRRIGNTEGALSYYIQAEEMEAENIHTTMMIGNCYLDLKEYDKALSYYFKVEYNNPGNIKILRPIAYCYLAMGRLDDSNKYYQRLSGDKLNVHDLINMGHLALCRNNKKEATDFYRRGIVSGELSKEKFSKIFNEDTQLLIGLGVKKDELSLLLDYLFFLLDK